MRTEAMTASRPRPSLLAPVFAALFFAFIAVGTAAAASGLRMLTGELGAARYTIARPEKWNRHLLLHAHGFRPEGEPLKATLDPTAGSYARLLQEGWIVATTSYRRNGLIVRDAIADLGALRDHIELSEGTPSLVLLIGESMGGAIVTLMAENEPQRYHGALAIGAALDARDPTYPVALTHRPKIPLLFLSNQSEVAGPAAYVEQAADGPVAPALWTVARDGHVNVNQDERTLALEGLIAWITTNQIERRRDATVLAALPKSEAAVADGAARGEVSSVTANHGNIFTNFRPADFAALGIERGCDFELAAGGRTWRVRYGGDYDDVPPGGWVAFERAEGVILIARNRDNAAETAGVKKGDPLVVRPLK
jgi:pimeloyl-ACP methyl ester carboxylesterase